MATIITDVLSAKDAISFVSSVAVTYSDDVLKKIIFDARDTDNYLLITKSIGSKITIKDVKIVDDALIDSMLVV